LGIRKPPGIKTSFRLISGKSILAFPVGVELGRSESMTGRSRTSASDSRVFERSKVWEIV
jgi:hypothetical protein